MNNTQDYETYYMNEAIQEAIQEEDRNRLLQKNIQIAIEAREDKPIIDVESQLQIPPILPKPIPLQRSYSLRPPTKLDEPPALLPLSPPKQELPDTEQEYYNSFLKLMNIKTYKYNPNSVYIQEGESLLSEATATWAYKLYRNSLKTELLSKSKLI